MFFVKKMSKNIFFIFLIPVHQSLQRSKFCTIAYMCTWRTGEDACFPRAKLKVWRFLKKIQWHMWLNNTATKHSLKWKLQILVFFSNLKCGQVPSPLPPPERRSNFSKFHPQTERILNGRVNISRSYIFSIMMRNEMDEREAPLSS